MCRVCECMGGGVTFSGVSEVGRGGVPAIFYMATEVGA